MKRRLLCCFLIAVMVCVLTSSSFALDDDEFDGYAADTLTVRVGYFGGPYYEKAVFAVDDLWAMDVVYADYTFIDNMPSVVIDHVAGVRLADVMDAAGIDLNSIETFFFWTRDKTSDYYTSYPKASLIDTPRYCYYSLPDNYDDETGEGNELATSYGVPVDTVLSLADDWERTIAGATFGSDYLNLNQNTRFRLIFGQTDAVTRTASRSAKWIHEIVVELGGAPTLTLDASVLEGEVGSVLRTEPSVSGEAAVVANAVIEWSSSDEAIATVDESGSITVHGEGAAVITASVAGATASVTVNGTPGEGTDAETSSPDGTGGDGREEPESGDGETGDGPNVYVPRLQETDAPRETPAPAETPKPVETVMPVQTPAPAATPEPVIEDPPPMEETAEDAEPEPLSVVEQSRNIQLMKLVTLAVREDGGIQNWREADMSDSATELPNIEVEASALGRLGAGAGGLFLGSGIVYAALFYIDIGHKKRISPPQGGRNTDKISDIGKGKRRK